MASCVDEKYQLVGSSEVMQRLREKVLHVAAHGNARVLVSGPSGSGKECVARMLHNRSPRAEKAFVTFNCATVAKELLEDRFFGHVKGAFTGADKSADGLFAAAEGDVRLVCATNRSLPRMVKEGKFRKDLLDLRSGARALLPPVKSQKLAFARHGKWLGK